MRAGGQFTILSRLISIQRLSVTLSQCLIQAIDFRQWLSLYWYGSLVLNLLYAFILLIQSNHLFCLQYSLLRLLFFCSLLNFFETPFDFGIERMEIKICQRNGNFKRPQKKNTIAFSHCKRLKRTRMPHYCSNIHLNVEQWIMCIRVKSSKRTNNSKLVPEIYNSRYIFGRGKHLPFVWCEHRVHCTRPPSGNAWASVSKAQLRLIHWCSLDVNTAIREAPTPDPISFNIQAHISFQCVKIKRYRLECAPHVRQNHLHSMVGWMHTK